MTAGCTGIHKQASLMMRAPFFPVLWILRTQTPTQNSSQRQTENRFLLCHPDAGNTWQMPPFQIREKDCMLWGGGGKKTQTHNTECFYLWRSTLIEFFNNAHQKRRTRFNLASLLYLQGINILERKGRFLWEGEKRGGGRKKKKKKG